MVGTAQTRLCPPYAFKSIQRNTLRIAAEIRGRAERLAVDRAIEVFARERRIADRRRKRVVLEFAVARQNFGAGIEPRARRDVNAGVRPLLVGTVRTSGAVIGPAVPVISGLGLGAGGGRADRNEGRRSKQHHELARSREFWGHRILVIVSPFGLADRQIGLAFIVAAAGSSSLGQLRHTGPE